MSKLESKMIVVPGLLTPSTAVVMLLEPDYTRELSTQGSTVLENTGLAVRIRSG
jgi:hypothetical protein